MATFRLVAPFTEPEEEATAPGTRVSLRVWLHNNDTIDHDDLCVGLVADNSLVTIPLPNPRQAESMFPGRRLLVAFDDIAISDEIAAGTTVRFVAWASLLRSNCAAAIVSHDLSLSPRQ
jgi:hypothetical protein